jgi:hypothetical protein
MGRRPPLDAWLHLPVAREVHFSGIGGGCSSCSAAPVEQHRAAVQLYPDDTQMPCERAFCLPITRSDVLVVRDTTLHIITNLPK